MNKRITMQCMGIVVVSVIGMAGCGIWPVMTEENGRRPHAMGKSDQVFSPWAEQPVHLSEDYGDSYRYAVEAQILNPQAAKSLKVVEGIGGGPAQQNMARYQDMFKKPPFSVTGSSSIRAGGSK
ncbi:MAG: hypothetical protein VST67_00405 [Nitrospirota bacterium]|nr:hypothetical protein [Nitrospirota bacterium]